MIHVLLLVTLTLMLPSLTQAATIYVSKTGSNSNSCDTAKAANGCSGGACSKLTIAAGVACMAGGDTLLVNSGTYTNDPIQNVPSGSASQRSIARSMNGKANTTLVNNDIGLDCVVCFGAHSYVDVDGFKLDGGLQSIFVLTSPNEATNVTVKNSEITRARGQGVDTNHSSGWLIENNEIHHNGDPPTNTQRHGVYLTASNSIVRNNYIHHNACYGMQVQAGEGTGGAPNNDKVYGNIFELNGSAGGLCSGLVVIQGSGHEVVNNVFINEAQGEGPNTSYIFIGVPNSIVYNNTLYCSTFLEYEFNTASSMLVANNLLYCPGVTLTITRRTGGALVGTYSSNLLNQNPNFVNVNAGSTGGFKLQSGSSVAVNAVSCRTQASPDAAGVTRPQPSGGQCDYGAYEFTAGGGTDPIPSSPIVVHVAPPPLGVDSRSCTVATSATTPRATLLGGIACLTVPESTLLLHAGTYVEAFDSLTEAIAGGTSYAAPTKIAAFGTDIVTIKAPAVDAPVFHFQNSSTDHYILLDRLVIDCDNLSGTNAVAIKGGANSIVVQNSELKNCYYEPVFTQDADGIIIQNNHIHHSSAGRCISFSQGSDNGVIDANNVHDCFGAGVQVTAPSTNVQVTRNTISLAGAGQSRPGIRLAGLTNPTVINNILFSNFVGLIVETGTTGLKILNNTVYGNTGNGVQIDAGATAAQLTNNIIAGNGGTNLVNNGTITTQLTNLFTTPLFVNAGTGDFHLQALAASAIDTGTTLTTDVPKDYEGITRPRNAGYDIGASEFTGTPGGGPGPDPIPGVGATASWRGQAFFW